MSWILFYCNCMSHASTCMIADRAVHGILTGFEVNVQVRLVAWIEVDHQLVLFAISLAGGAFELKVVLGLSRIRNVEAGLPCLQVHRHVDLKIGERDRDLLTIGNVSRVIANAIDL